MMDIHPERTKEDKPLLIIPALIWFGCIVASIVIALMLTGCATETAEMRAEVCYLKFMGNTEEGYTVVMSACQTPEQFAEGQQ